MIMLDEDRLRSHYDMVSDETRICPSVAIEITLMGGAAGEIFL
jgi:hypothetical protein